MVTRIFLCNEQTEPEIRDFIREAIAEIAEGEQYIVTWNCGNIQTLKVGDRAYFKRIGSANQGYFASGTIVPADREYQLKQRSARYRELSEAYDIDSSASNFRVWVAWDACVTFDEPLRSDYLRQLPSFQGMPLEPQTDAGVFREEYVQMLDREWERQTQKAFRAGKTTSISIVTEKVALTISRGSISFWISISSISSITALSRAAYVFASTVVAPRMPRTRQPTFYTIRTVCKCS